MLSAILLLLQCLGHVELLQDVCLSEETMLQVTSSSNDTAYEIFSATPVLECAARCSEDTRCVYFRVDPTSITCYVYSNDSTDMTEQKGRNIKTKTSNGLGETSNSVTADTQGDTQHTLQCVQGLVNTAFNKPTNQSSTWDEYYASSVAVDGNLNNDSDIRPYCTHTSRKDRSTEWLSVDLEAVYEIQNISIWNRGDCCWKRLSNFTVYVGNRSLTDSAVNYKPWVYHPGWFKGMKTLSCDQWSRGQFVKIEITNGQHLTLCEVEVYPKLCSSG